MVLLRQETTLESTYLLDTHQTLAMMAWPRSYIPLSQLGQSNLIVAPSNKKPCILAVSLTAVLMRSYARDANQFNNNLFSYLCISSNKNGFFLSSEFSESCHQCCHQLLNNIHHISSDNDIKISRKQPNNETYLLTAIIELRLCQYLTHIQPKDSNGTI
jgi:hypothetical protein